MKTLATFMGCLLAVFAAQGAKELPDPEAWSLRAYHFQREQWGFSGPSLDGPVPTLPAATATAEEIQKFIRQSDKVMEGYFQKLAVPLPKGSLAAYDPVSNTLAIRTQNLTHEVIHRHLGHFIQFLTFNAHVVELDRALLDAMMRETAATGYRDLWPHLRTMVEQGKVRELGTLRLDTRSGQRSRVAQGENRQYDTGFTLDEHDRLVVNHDQRTVGTTLQIDPCIAPDGQIVDASFDFRHDFGPPTERWATAAWNGPQRLESRLTSFHGGHIISATTTISGRTKLIGIWEPEEAPGQQRTGRVQAAFLGTEVVSVVAPLDNRVAQLLKEHGEKVEPTPAVASPPDGMVRKAFALLPDFGGADMEQILKTQPAATAQKILEDAGVPFPKGSSASYSFVASELVVCNLPKHLEAVERYLDVALPWDPRKIKTIVMSVHVVQADAALLRKLSEQTQEQADQTEAWHAVEEAAAQGHAKILDSAWLETRSGQTANISSGTSYAAVGTAKLAKAAGAAPLSVTHETTQAGLAFEAEPVLGPDGQTLDVNYAFSYDYAPPVPQPDTADAGANTRRVASAGTDFHRASITTSITLNSGMTRLLGVWKPEGAPEFQKGDVLQGAFLKVEAVSLGED